ncbi:hypothetical protein IFR05_016503, partial [Cadophora sp. M221]
PIHLLSPALPQGPKRFKPAGPNLASAAAQPAGAGRCAETMASGAGHRRPSWETRTGRAAKLGEIKVQVTGEGTFGKEDLSSGIGLVIDRKIKHFREARLWNEIDDDAHEVLAEKMSQVINRGYLWIALVFPELEMYTGASQPELVAVYDTLLSTVTEAYEKILDRSLNRAKATKLLHIATK